MADKDAEAPAPGDSSSGIRVRAAGFYSFPSPAGGAAFVCAHFCVQTHLPSPLNHSLATSCDGGTAKSAEGM